MLAADLIDLLRNTPDGDLRYMALREHVLSVHMPLDDKNVEDLVSRVLIPALSDQDSTVQELTSTQVLPHVARTNPEVAEEYVILPLCQELRRKAYQGVGELQALQALRNVLRQAQWSYNSFEAVQEYVEYMNSARERPYIAWESLALLLDKVSADHVTSSIYCCLYSLALRDSRAATFKAMQVATAKVSPGTLSTALSQHELSLPHIALLAHITAEKYAFKQCYQNLIGYVLQCVLSSEHFGHLYAILENLVEWLEQPKMGPPSPQKTQLWHDVIAMCNTVLAQAQDEPEIISDGEDSDQDAYMAELSDIENEEPQFEEEEQEQEEPSHLAHVLKLLVILPNEIPIETQNLLAKVPLKEDTLIPIIRAKHVGYDILGDRFPNSVDSQLLDSMPSEFAERFPNSQLVQQRREHLAGEPQLSPDASSESVKSVLLDKPHINETTRLCILNYLHNALSVETEELFTLQSAVELSSLACRRAEFQNSQDSLASWALPHLKPNKLFTKIIKVGNMKQTIDDGVSLRLNCYALLQQLQVSYGLKCLILQECVERGLKDETRVKEVAVTLLSETLHAAWFELRIRDNKWLQEALFPRIIERINKFYSTNPQASATCQQIADWDKSTRCIERLKRSVDQYIIIINDEDIVPL